MLNNVEDLKKLYAKLSAFLQSYHTSSFATKEEKDAFNKSALGHFTKEEIAYIYGVRTVTHKDVESLGIASLDELIKDFIYYRNRFIRDDLSYAFGCNPNEVAIASGVSITDLSVGRNDLENGEHPEFKVVYGNVSGFPVCPNVVAYLGDLNVSESNYKSVSNVKVVGGNFTIGGDINENVTLSSLEYIGKDAMSSSSAALLVSMPNIKYIGGKDYIKEERLRVRGNNDLDQTIKTM